MDKLKIFEKPGNVWVKKNTTKIYCFLPMTTISLIQRLKPKNVPNISGKEII